MALMGMRDVNERSGEKKMANDLVEGQSGGSRGLLRAKNGGRGTGCDWVER